MSTVTATGDSVRAVRGRFSISRKTLAVLAIWLVAAAIAIFFSLLLKQSSFVHGHYIPRTDDSFYHARRILDAAVGTRGFYQFDQRLHAPDGAWIPWPWAYDYLMAKAVQVALWIHPSTDPMAFISYVPVAWILVNSALFLAAAGAAGLSLPMRCLAMLGFAFSPLTQLLHAVGMIDHHYIEYTFVLLTLWLGLEWFARPERSLRAGLLGVALGLAPGFQNGLFILQLLPLSCVFILWLRDNAPPIRSLLTFAGTLVLSTQLVLLPSEPYWRGMFDFGLLSWFHFYVAVCTAAVMAFVSSGRCSRGRLTALLALSSLLVLPLGAQVMRGDQFLTAHFSILSKISETLSPYQLFTNTFGPIQTASYYSWLLLAAPLLLAYYVYRCVRERTPKRLFYALGAVFGLALLLTQFRFHYMGMFALITGGLLIVEDAAHHLRWRPVAVFGIGLAVWALAYQPALRDRLFKIYAPASDSEYAAAMPLFADLSDLCTKDPGVVLANSDDGNAILFHTECSVIANNFILSNQDREKLNEVARLMRSDPAYIRASGIKYLLVRATDFSVRRGDRWQLDASNAIAKKLFLAKQPPEGFKLIQTIWSSASKGSKPAIYARLYEIDPLHRGSG